MNINQKENLKFYLRGKSLKLTTALLISRLCNIMFVLYSLSVFYLLIFDVTLITETGLYENRFIAGLICFTAVSIGFVLLFLSVWQTYRSNALIYSSVENVTILKFRIKYALKLLILKFITFTIKIICILIALLPAASIAVLCLYLLAKGVSVAVLIVLSVSDIVLFFNSFISSITLIKKLYLCDFCFSENPDRSIIQFIRESCYLTDGKCTRLAKHSLLNLVLTVAGFIFPFFSVKKTIGEFIIATDKIIPHAHRNAHTEKAIIFYIGEKINAG